jgi:hypothetical protein
MWSDKGEEMISYKVTWFNSNTGNQNSMTGKASSLESALAEETRMVEMMQKRSPHISLVSVEKV